MQVSLHLPRVIFWVLFSSFSTLPGGLEALFAHNSLLFVQAITGLQGLGFLGKHQPQQEVCKKVVSLQSC